MHEKVIEFNKKYGFTVGASMSNTDEDPKYLFALGNLTYLQEKLSAQSECIKDIAYRCKAEGDDRLFRMYLMLEELAEISGAMAARDKVALADGLADLRFVNEGTAVTYDIPLQECFDEVCISNLTKNQSDLLDSETRRDKTMGYVPPDIEGILYKYDVVNKVCNSRDGEKC